MNKKLLFKKLNNLSKQELAVLQKITFTIETRFYNVPGEKYDDLLKKERFGKIDESELFRMARMLNEEFKIFYMSERNGLGFTISFKDGQYNDFLKFRKMINEELERNDGTSVDKIYRPFKFKDKALIGGSTTNKLSIKKENSHEYIVLEKAFELPVKRRIDAMSFEDADNLSFQQIYDTARRLNKKIEDDLGVKGFFKFDYPNKYIMRVAD